MGDCKFCGESAGLFHHQHKECAAAHEAAIAQITSALDQALTVEHVSDSLVGEIEGVSQRGHLAQSEQRALVIQSWSRALDRFISEGALDEAREARLQQLMKMFGLTKEELNQTHSFERLVKAAVLREIMHGQVPRRFEVTGNLPLNFQKGEQLVWAFAHTEYLEDAIRREYVGGSSGVSVRVAKGVYFHTSAFKGHPVDRNVRTHVDTGVMAVTDKNLYFAGSRKSLRIPFGKMVSFQPYTDGLGLTRDASTAKPQVFITGDGWFTYNLVVNLAKL